jgi:hypothetical protein
VRLVYADWLEERGDARGEFLRAESMLANLSRNDPRFPSLQTRCEELAAKIERTWYLFIEMSPRKSRILNCAASPSPAAGVRFAFRCPNRWSTLKQTVDEGVRFCVDCQQKVFYCDTEEGARQHALAGHCIAITSKLAAEVESARVAQEDLRDGMTLGIVMPSRRPLPLVDENAETYQKWGQTLVQAPEHGQAGGVERKRWWQFWK